MRVMSVSALPSEDIQIAPYDQTYCPGFCGADGAKLSAG